MQSRISTRGSPGDGRCTLLETRQPSLTRSWLKSSRTTRTEEDSKHNSRQETSSPSSRVRKAMSVVSWTWKSESAPARSSRTWASHARTRVLQPSLPASTSHRCASTSTVSGPWMVYKHGIFPVVIETITSIILEAPLVHRQEGRPNVNHIRHHDEDRPKKVYNCSVCLQSGNTKKTCQNTVHNEVFLMRFFHPDHSENKLQQVDHINQFLQSGPTHRGGGKDLHRHCSSDHFSPSMRPFHSFNK